MLLTHRTARPPHAFTDPLCTCCEICSGRCASATHRMDHATWSPPDMPIPTIYQRHPHRPDAERARLREQVDVLHAMAARATGETAEILAEAAATIDSCQAGLILCTPHPLTGWRIVPETDAAVRDAYAETDAAATPTDLARVPA